MIRRIALRGAASDGVAVSRADLVPEVTITADGVYWHPVGAEDADLLVTPDIFPLSESFAAVRRAFDREASMEINWPEFLTARDDRGPDPRLWVPHISPVLRNVGPGGKPERKSGPVNPEPFNSACPMISTLPLLANPARSGAPDPDQFPQSGGVRFSLRKASFAAAISGLNSRTRNAVARASSKRFSSQSVTTRFMPRSLLPGA